MRRVVVLALIAIGTLVALLLFSEGTPDRARGARDVAAPGLEDPATRSAAEVAAADPAPRAPVEGRLCDPGGNPAGDVLLHLVAAHRLETHTFRSGEWPARTVWLCPRVEFTRTAADGTFSLPPPPLPTMRWFVSTTSASDDYFVAGEVTGAELLVQARCAVTGVLRDHDGNAMVREWVEGQRGAREDWHLRVDREPPMYVSGGGPMEIDGAGPCGVETDDEGRFVLRLLPGPSTLAFGEQARLGTLPVHVAGERLDLGEIRLPLDPAPEGEGPHALVVQVYDAQGAPRADAEVLLWDGVVGIPSHSEWTDEHGIARFEGLHADEVMAWTVPVDRPYLAEPEQCTGRLRLPCEAPVVLRARRPEEYVVVRLADVGWGYCLLLRGDRLLGGFDVLDRDGFAVPPGDYRAIVVGRRVILQADLALFGAPEITVERSRFALTTTPG